ncbi:MAG: DUF4255 domain-containing protein [Methylobacterium sp.]|nr:DUF4255 domain-containing protein [Methylobacterium sp.]
MADFNAIAAVSRSLRRLLTDRMSTLATVTLTPPDVTPSGLNGARVNLYLFHLAEHPQLKNQNIPGRDHPASYGLPPLALTLRYLLTTHARAEDQPDSDLIAQTLMGDAMLALHDLGGGIEALRLLTNRAGAIGDPVLDPVLQHEFERIKLTLVPTPGDEIARLWSAIPEANFRRSAIYEVSAVQIETRRTRRQAPPVETRRILMSVTRPPRLTEAYRIPAPGSLLRDPRIGVTQAITIEHDPLVAERLYVRFGRLPLIRVPLPSHGRITLALPDDSLPADLDNPAPRAIAPADRLQPGVLEVALVSVAEADGVSGGLDHGVAITGERDLRSNTALMQLVPLVTAAAPAFGQANAILRLNGHRLWQADALSEVIVGDALIPVRPPGPGDAFAAPTPTQVEIPVSAVAAVLAPSATPYPVAVQVNGVRSAAAGFSFRLDP